MSIPSYGNHWSFAKSQHQATLVTLEDGTCVYEMIFNLPPNYLDVSKYLETQYEEYPKSFGPVAQLGER